MQTLINLFKLLRYRWWLYVGTLCIALVLYITGIIPALISRWIFDSLTDGAELTFGLWSMIALLSVTTVARQTLYVIQIMGRSTDAYIVGGLIRSNLMQHLLSHANMNPLSGGEAISRFRDDVQGITGFIGSSYHFLSSMAFGIVAGIILWRINPPITLTVIVPLALVTIIINQSRTRVVRYREENQAATSRVTGMLGEIFSGILALKLYNAEGAALERLETLNQRREEAAVQDHMFSELLDTISVNISDIGAGVILLLVGQAMQTGEFTVGDFALFVYMLPWVSTFTSAFGGILAGYRRLGVSWSRLVAMLDGDEPERLTAFHDIPLRADIPIGGYKTNPLTSPKRMPLRQASGNGFTSSSSHLYKTNLYEANLYEAKGISFTYPGSQNGVHDVDIQLPVGTATVITGRVGSGKSTLLRLLLGLLPADSGGIYWKGQLVTEPSTFFAPPCTAYTPQTPVLFSDSLRENILMGLDLRIGENFTESHGGLRGDLERRIGENTSGGKIENVLNSAIRSAVLEEDIRQLEQGLDTVVGPRGVRLSGGQILRSAAARMFVRQPELLVFDDLSSALDVETETLLWARLFGENSRADSRAARPTCLIVSHRRAALEQADNIILLKDGRIAESGPLEALLNRSPEMWRLWDGEYDALS